LLLVGTTLACNELENLVNKERRKNGLRALHCDPNMRWVARKHIVDQEQGAPKNWWPTVSECSLHSWFVKNPCCYKRDHSNMQCMHNKPLELSGWDNRLGFEISAWSSRDMTAIKAINQWRGSSGHYAVIVSKGFWSGLRTVGCSLNKNYAHCWFSKKKL